MPEVEVGAGTWVQVKPGVPEQFQTIADTIDSVATALLAILNIALVILNVIKAFLVGFLNPIIAIIEGVISVIEALLNDIRQIGVYVSGDLNIKPPFDQIRGGYSAYERRMIGLLVDPRDPNRPNFSGRTTALAIFLYVNVDISNIQLLIRVVRQITRFLGLRGELTNFTKPVGLKVEYSGVRASFKKIEQLSRGPNGETPTTARISWGMGAAVAGGVSYPQPAPSGFLIEVSTLKDGLLIGWEAPINSPIEDEQGQQVRVSGVYKNADGKPFRLYGGYESLVPTALSTLGPMTRSGTRRPGAPWIYAFKSAADPTPIPLYGLKEGSGESAKFAFQRTFYVKNNLTTSLPGQGFRATLDYNDMPYNADISSDSSGEGTLTFDESPATTLYVRVSAVTDVVTAEKYFKYSLSTSEIDGAVSMNRVVEIKGEADKEWTDKGPASDAATVMFPQEVQYLDTVTAALVVLVLSRSDLPVSGGGTDFEPGFAATATGLEGLAKDLNDQMFRKPGTWFGKTGGDPKQFRNQILWRCRTLANIIIERSGCLGPSTEAYVVEQGSELLSWKWSEVNTWYPDATILDSLSETSLGKGVGRNYLSIGQGGSLSVTLSRLRVQGMDRSPGFLVKSGSIRGSGDRGSGDHVSPVVYGIGSMDFCRNAFPTEIYTAAAKVLNIATAPMTLPPQVSNWHTYRLLPQGIPALENALQKILDWLESLKAAADSIIEAILAYIAFIEARILQIQALITQINALIQKILDFDFPSMNGLIVTGSGTMGLVGGLVQAEEKPSDSSGSYGAGVGLVTGGVPTVILDLIKLFFPEE